MDAQTFKAEATQGINDVRQVVYDTVHSGCDARNAMTQGSAAADASAAGAVLGSKGETVIDKWSKGAEGIKEAAVATGNYVKDTAVTTGHLAKEALFGSKAAERAPSNEPLVGGQEGYCDDVRCHNFKPCALHSGWKAEASKNINQMRQIVYDNVHSGCDARDAMTSGTPSTDAQAAGAVLAQKGETVIGKWSEGAEKVKEAAAATGNYVKDTAVSTGHLAKEAMAEGAHKVREVASAAGQKVKDMTSGGIQKFDEAAHIAGTKTREAAHSAETKVKDAAHSAETKVRDVAHSASATATHAAHATSEKLKEVLPRSKESSTCGCTDSTCGCTDDTCKCTGGTCKCTNCKCTNCKCTNATCTCTPSTVPATTESADPLSTS